MHFSDAQASFLGLVNYKGHLSAPWQATKGPSWGRGQARKLVPVRDAGDLERLAFLLWPKHPIGDHDVGVLQNVRSVEAVMRVCARFCDSQGVSYLAGLCRVRFPSRPNQVGTVLAIGPIVASNACGSIGKVVLEGDGDCSDRPSTRLHRRSIIESMGLSSFPTIYKSIAAFESL